MVEGQRVFTPIKLDKGPTSASTRRRIGSSPPGSCGTRRGQLAEKAFLIEQPMGRGHVIAFAEDPNYRAFTEATELLFINAVLLGPAH